MTKRKPGRPKKDNPESTKEDLVPHDDNLREEMIAKFIAENKNNEELFQVFEAVPYEHNQMVRSTAGGKKKSS
jgi:hypothetical protein